MSIRAFSCPGVCAAASPRFGAWPCNGDMFPTRISDHGDGAKGGCDLRGAGGLLGWKDELEREWTIFDAAPYDLGEGDGVAGELD